MTSEKTFLDLFPAKLPTKGSMSPTRKTNRTCHTLSNYPAHLLMAIQNERERQRWLNGNYVGLCKPASVFHPILSLDWQWHEFNEGLLRQWWKKQQDSEAFTLELADKKSDGVSRSLGDPYFKRKTRNSSFKPQSKGIP